MPTNIKTVGVIGHTGMVGKTVYRWFQESGFETHGYSTKPDDGEQQATLNADVVFICVPTPYHWDGRGFDGSIVEEVLSKIKEGSIAVIKSTVKVGTTNKLQEKYPKLKLLFNPEFLSESTSWADFTNPDRQFVGYTKESYGEATNVLNILPESAYDLICPAKEAELLKYINNIHGILEIMESNLYYDVCQKEGLDYDRVVKAMVSSKWVGCPMGRHYRVIYHKGKRGIGGRCFPKDLHAWLEYGKEQGLDFGLFQSARDYNHSLLEKQGLTEETSERVSSDEDMKKLKEEQNEK